jgi:hypothetical protein
MSHSERTSSSEGMSRRLAGFSGAELPVSRAPKPTGPMERLVVLL